MTHTSAHQSILDSLALSHEREKDQLINSITQSLQGKYQSQIDELLRDKATLAESMNDWKSRYNELQTVHAHTHTLHQELLQSRAHTSR